ncbi:pyridoxamine 5'-phosphate oxidase family protein [Kutzneria viridogrisea]|uniref:Pyridoxamine 5'-phosphate oxidase N-terminal domain-containing protein n=1 Tax=Kutzneria albida DSM 43870 TaxID=1449976 RepID=W5WB70_9PSEU|nr:hypothetical protein KALB_5041 [Kutzneria albida DSM 43870]
MLGEPGEVIKAKVRTRIDSHFHRFIAHSPFLCLATTDAAGYADCSPRGDYPGFVKVLDEHTLAIPDRLGNKLADSFTNIADNPGVGLIFLVPGHRETLRVNGTAYATDEPDVLARMQVEGKRPVLATIVEVREAFMHCGRAVVRSRLWHAESQALAEEVPSLGQIVADQLALDAAAVDADLEAAYKVLY